MWFMKCSYLKHMFGDDLATNSDCFTLGSQNVPRPKTRGTLETIACRILVLMRPVGSIHSWSVRTCDPPMAPLIVECCSRSTRGLSAPRAAAANVASQAVQAC